MTKKLEHYKKANTLAHSANPIVKRGLTIIELAAVIVIIGILAAISIPQYKGLTQRSRDTERKADISNISTQIEQYKSRTGGYPTAANLNSPAFRDGNKLSSGDNNGIFADPKSPTNSTLVSEVTPNNVYSYTPAPSGCASPTSTTGSYTSPATPCTTYVLVARLEELNDPDKDTSSTYSSLPNAYYVKRNAN